MKTKETLRHFPVNRKNLETDLNMHKFVGDKDYDYSSLSCVNDTKKRKAKTLFPNLRLTGRINLDTHKAVMSAVKRFWVL